MKDVIYYNLWDDQLEPRQAALQDKLVIAVSDRQYGDLASNEAAFSASLQSFLRELQTSVVVGANYQRFLKTRIKWLQNLHASYLNRLAKDQTVTKDQLLSSIDSWAIKTKALLKSAVEQQEDAFFSPVNVLQNDRCNNPKGNALWRDKSREIFAEMMSTIDQSAAYLRRAVESRNEGAGHQGKSPTVSFRGCIKNKEKVDAFMSILHKHIDGKSGIKACIYIQAAIEAEIFFDRPNYAQANEEFPGLATRSIYDRYVGARCDIHEKHYPAIDAVIAELKSLLPAEN